MKSKLKCNNFHFDYVLQKATYSYNLQSKKSIGIIEERLLKIKQYNGVYMELGQGSDGMNLIGARHGTQ